MIVDHGTVGHIDWRGIARPCYVVECDFCGERAPTVGNDVGEAANEARKRGYQTVKGAPTEPMKWWCGQCSKKP